ncbi:hypothetical protein NQ315_001735 [Exocentrus adspersus]|uniref:Integrin beta n=1 Tax=Exocentrus adspersus TaxID=1586481 RepID=A0AAV8WAB8_9CUCU|nr:hypothetical protein NQ315_001735 [Exocentrus adspersus]
MYHNIPPLLLLLLVISVDCQSASTLKCTDVAIQSLCIDQEACDQCLQAHPCCNWCYDQNYDGRQCNVLENLSACPETKLELNTENKVEIPEFGNQPFTDGSAKEIIQLRPQFLNVYLAKDIPQNFTFTYKPAKNYPLDLYYLGDLSASMMAHLSVFKTIGADLPNNLTQLTENYKLAYGSFLDKVAMPFYLMAPDTYNNPCSVFSSEECETGYLFKHWLGFTKDTDTFIKKIINSKITANLDDLDGALDAILQILVCDKKIGWSKNSRKIILLPTDSLLHSAGDGILAGAVLKPNRTCLLDDEGNHMSPLTYDYPSFAQIHALLNEKKVNIIFAVKTQRKLEYYKSLTTELFKDSGFVGELEEDATNILELINKGYYNFVRQVKFFINTTSSENLDVKFFGDCDRLGIFNETSACYNVENEPVDFTVQLTLKGPPTKLSDVFYVEERNINERITLNITYTGHCSCDNYDGEELECLNGDFRCGKCMCQEEWTGKLCEENCDSKDFSSCKSSSDGYICNRNGDCICGKCSCNPPFNGQYCQYRCPTSKDGQVCSGPAQGKCIEDKCECINDFEYEDCSCSKSKSRCKLFEEMEFCSGNGNCVCNQCRCNAGFSGQFCESNKENNTLCEEYIKVIEDAILSGTNTAYKGTTKISIQEVNEDKRKSLCNDTECETVIYQGNSRCTIKCCYLKQDGDVHWLTTKSCVLTAGFAALTSGIVALALVLLAGAFFIACAKYRIYRLEQEEYRKFQNESGTLHEMNPIYKDPVSTYRNPMREKND